MNLFTRIVAILAIGGWLILPFDFGLGVLLWTLSKTQPVLALILALAMTIIIFTVWDLKLESYKRFTQLALAAMAIVFHLQAWLFGLLPFANWQLWIVTVGLSAVFILVAWPMISNRLWQATHYKRAADIGDSDSGAPGVQ